jgi:DNA (cytosine-5)-methyltransferase 1
MVSRPRLLDLFCGPGGAGVGYHRAGWEVTGVDLDPQPDYPFTFVQGDALDYLADHGHAYDAVHASPPCTEHTSLTRSTAGRGDRTGTAGLLPATLAALESLPHGLWVVENVMGARMPTDLILCGSMFGLRTYRHRRFTIGPGVPMLSVPDHPKHRVLSTRGQAGIKRTEAWDQGWNFTVTGNDAKMSRKYRPMMEQALGIDWIKGDGLALAIPPAYAQYLGALLLDHVRSPRW